ncbi:hypothetical protein L873DRAFT_1820093 [Choiromyces venosus 120613-1]|uniref:Uncharacterized protein n=1 Tax=Choiromyces venosus 120613-1 TaxID=1336337 RepID=A0A3N4ISX5_9PEZI|nr:hypothetical protein L873DRAFT_1823648 [Choiromyces venosus 120613-1]RPA90988.1 hypothetical protein L873DRAFT_1820093 [Choiromyces venosus 120613-1]
MSTNFSNFSGWPYYMWWLCGNILKRAIFGVFWTLSTNFSIATVPEGIPKNMAQRKIWRRANLPPPIIFR